MTDPLLTVTPASPASGDLVTFTVTGTVDSPATILVTSDDGSIIARSPTFGIGDIPEGTGREAYSLTLLGGTSGEFTFDVYAWGDGANAVTTDPIYFYNDDPVFAYPTSAAIAAAIEGGLPGSSVTVDRLGSLMTILIGGDFSGKRVGLTIDEGDTGATATLTDVDATGGPFVFGPLMLTDDDYTADLMDDEDSSLLDTEVSFTVGA
jgi:hypothetical protein